MLLSTSQGPECRASRRRGGAARTPSSRGRPRRLLPRGLSLGLFAGWLGLSGLSSGPAVGQPVEAPVQSPFDIRSVTVNGKSVSLGAGNSLALRSKVETLEFIFAPNSLVSNAPIRSAWQLDGLETGWQEGKTVNMRMIVRFMSESRETRAEQSFPVRGQTPGWTGRLSDSPLGACTSSP